MNKFDIIQADITPALNQPWGGSNLLHQDMGNPRPGIAEPPRRTKPDEEPDAPDQEPAKKKKKRNIYEITC